MANSLIFATGNRHKLGEVQSFLGDSFALSCLKDVEITEDIPETADTLEGNALQKALYVYHKCGCACFSDDTGLEIEALNGEPGVHSARYAGSHKNDQDNVKKVLKLLQGETNRRARFRTVIAYIDKSGESRFFEGEVRGTIIESCHGTEGFGYDPIFMPDGYDCTFAELSLNEKNKISHRARALQKFLLFLKPS